MMKIHLFQLLNLQIFGRTRDQIDYIKGKKENNNKW